MFDTFVLLPHWTSSPPDSLAAWLANPQYPDVPAYMRPLLISALVVPIAAFLFGIPDGPGRRVWLGLAVVCILAHLALVFAFFIPTNQLLGFLPSAETAPEPDAERVRSLVSQWTAWNRVRIALDAMGLYAAARGATA